MERSNWILVNLWKLLMWSNINVTTAYQVNKAQHFHQHILGEVVHIWSPMVWAITARTWVLMLLFTDGFICQSREPVWVHHGDCAPPGSLAKPDNPALYDQHSVTGDIGISLSNRATGFVDYDTVLSYLIMEYDIKWKEFTQYTHEDYLFHNISFEYHKKQVLLLGCITQSWYMLIQTIDTPPRLQNCHSHDFLSPDLLSFKELHAKKQFCLCKWNCLFEKQCDESGSM